MYLCNLVLLLKEVTIHIWNQLWNLVFPRIRKGSSLCGLDWKENPEKRLRQWKGVSLSWKPNLCVCVTEKDNSFKIHVIILRYIKNVKFPFKKDFKFAELLTKTSFFRYFRDRPKNGEWNKLRRRGKYMRKSI